jgi:nitroreductase
VELEPAIRTRRSHKRFGGEPVPHEIVAELLELARWAPNHHLTEPWRFRVLGPKSLARLAATGKPGELEKLSRAPTLVVASARLTGD